MRRAKKINWVVSVGLVLLFLHGFNIFGKIIFRSKKYDTSRMRHTIQHTPLPSHQGDNFCAAEPPRLVGKLYVNNDTSSARTFQLIRIINGLSPASRGFHEPVNCKSRQTVAIIIPFRDREVQLRLLLNHLFPILRRQDIAFAIYVINHVGNGLFNRAKLFNVGISESLKDRDYDCFIFHDTDLLLKDDRCLYRCNKEYPVHLSRYIDIFDYQPLKYFIKCPPPGTLNMPLEGFGGVSAMTRGQIQDANGYSNLYWGWGGEDDDMIMRMLRTGYMVIQPTERTCSYIMIRHEREKLNVVNDGRYKLLRDSFNRMAEDGLNSLIYDVISVERNPLYINITVDIGNELKSSEYILKNLQGICENEEDQQ